MIIRSIKSRQTLFLVVTIISVSVLMYLYQTDFLLMTATTRHYSCQKTARERPHSNTILPVLQDHKIDASELKVCSETVKNPYNGSEGWQKFTVALDQYKHFHQQQLQILRRGDTGAAHIRTLTFSCHEEYCSGMGDQLHRIEFVFLLAVMSNRLFTIKWDEGLTRKNKYLLPNMINWNVSINETLGSCREQNGQCSRPTFDKTSIIWQCWKKRDWKEFTSVLFGPTSNVVISGRVKLITWFVLDSSMIGGASLIRKGFSRLGILDILTSDQENCRVRLDFTFTLWQYLGKKFGLDHILEVPDKSKVEITKPWFQLSHHILHYLFTFHPALIAQANQVQRTLGIYENKYLAIHLRTGYIGTPFQESWGTRWTFNHVKLFFDTKSWQAILEHSVKLATDHLGPAAPIYLATDSYMTVELALSKYGDRIKTSSLDIQPHSATTHNSNSGPKCGSEVDSDDKHLSFWVDFFMLGRAYIMVHGYSSFAMSAGWLCPIPLDRHSWVLYSDTKHCLASHIESNVSCIL